MLPTSNIDVHTRFYKIKPDDGWVIRTCTYDIECPLLLEIGAAFSLIDHQTFLSIAASRLPLHPSHTQLQTAGGGQMNIFGEATLALTFDGFHNHKVLYEENRVEPWVRLLHVHGCEMSMRDGLLKIGPTTFALTKHVSQVPSNLVTDFEILARSAK